ncbi:MAG: DUF4012 domain-containing protein [Acidimicrobiales bacterium]
MGRPRRASGTTWAAAAVAAVLALPVDAHPTGSPAVDVIVRGGAAAILVGLGARARRWTWFVLLGGVVALDSRPLTLLVVAASLGVALFSTVSGERRKSHGGIVTVLVSVLLYRLPHHASALTTAGVVAATTVPALWSGYRVLPRHRRRVVEALAEGTAVVVGVIVVLFVVAAAQSRSQLRQGVLHIRAGREAATRGNQDEAVQGLDAGALSFSSGRRTLGAWWAQPARFLPVFGPQARALTKATETAKTVTGAAADAASRTDYRRLRAGPGRINLPRLISYRRPLADLTASLGRADRSLRDIDDTWLIAPLRSQVNALSTQLGAARRDASVARRVLRVAPDLLGASGPRRYALWFTTPAESRELGGYLGSFGELTAVDGRIKLARTGRITDLLPATAAELEARRFPGESKLPARYRYYDVPHFLGNATGTEDLGLAAKTFAEVYRRSGGSPVDGIITLDPYALAAILRLTGPVQVEGVPAPLTAENAANFLFREQYAAFGDRAERADFLAAALRATFDQLTSQPLPEPQQLARTLSPLTSQRRLLVSSFDPKDQAMLEDLHLTGAVPKPDGADWLSVTNANANPNKIDAYLQRRIATRVRYDPTTGHTESEVTVTLTNTAPAADLPGGVTANTVGLPPGTNRTFLSVSSPLSLRSASKGGRAAGVEPEADPRLGVTHYGLFVDVPPKGSVVVRLRLRGDLRPSYRYRLTLVDQPLVNPDHLDLAVSGPVAVDSSDADGPFQLRREPGSGVRYRGVAVGGVGVVTARFLGQP